MNVPTPAHVPDTCGRKKASDLSRISLDSRIKDLALRERDAVRRRYWSAARAAAEERATLQTARQTDTD